MYSENDLEELTPKQFAALGQKRRHRDINTAESKMYLIIFSIY